MAAIEKCGVNFTASSGAPGLILVAGYKHTELLVELLKRGASILQTGDNKRFALNYMLASFISGKRQKQKLQQHVMKKLS
jgi:hypothetical protein